MSTVVFHVGMIPVSRHGDIASPCFSHDSGSLSRKQFITRIEVRVVLVDLLRVIYVFMHQLFLYNRQCMPALDITKVFNLNILYSNLPCGEMKIAIFCERSETVGDSDDTGAPSCRVCLHCRYQY